MSVASPPDAGPTPPRRATLDEVARSAGVSRSTASRALSGGVASAAAVAAVRRATERLGFVPNRAARGLARQRTDAVALVIPETPSFIFYDPFLAIVTSTVSAACWKAGLQPMMVLMDPADPVHTIERFLHAGNVDGMIVTSFHHHPGMEDPLTTATLPAVFIGRPPPGSAFPYVDVANRAGARHATEHLLGLGRRHIACLSGSFDMAAAVDRRDGFWEAHRAAGVEPGPCLEGSFTARSGLALARRLLDEYPEVDAIFAQSDALAAGAIQVLTAAGRLVPDDLAVVGFDDFPTATEVFPNLTTVAQPVTELAQAAADLMIGQLKTGQWGDWPQILPTRLVVRQSA
ncbi:MAG: LacI family transcriptional regulator [Propionibacteriaceae bacterium]|nr:LacI family transcriptional regulator [Propionibacteriaceae bacterium]